MRQMSLKNIIFAPEGSSRAEATLHRLYLAVCLTLLGVGTHGAVLRSREAKKQYYDADE